MPGGQDEPEKSINIMNFHSIGISNVGVRGTAVSFSSLNYPLRILNDVNKHKNKPSTRSSPPIPPPASTVPISSHPVKTDEPKNSSETQKAHSCLSGSCPAVNQENTVGIIGGVSVLSTLIFLEKLIWWSSRDGESVPFIVCSDPMLRQQTYKPSMKVTSTSCCSSSYSCDSKKYIFSEVDQTPVVDHFRRQRMFLEEGGARCIVMPCHVSHVWYGEISQGCKLPFLHVADCVARELKEARFKPLEAGCGVKIGVIVTDGAPVAGVYQEKLQNEGFEVVFPDEPTMEHIVNPAVKSFNQKDKVGAQNLLRIAIQVLLVRAANVVILASDELQGLLPHDDPLSKKCVDPMDSLARSVVRWAKSAKVHDNIRHNT